MHERVLFVVNGHAFTAQHRLPIIASFTRAGYTVRCAAPSGSEALQVFRSIGIPCVSLPMSRRGLNPLRELQTLAALVRLYRRLRPDILYHATIKPVLYGSLAARLSGVSTVMNAITGLGSVFIAEGVRAALIRRVVLLLYWSALRRHTTLVLFQNRDDQAYLVKAIGLRRSRSVLIRGSGVDTTVYTPSALGRKEDVVLFVGRMLRDKGVVTFVRAAEIVRKATPGARFVLVGDPDPGNPSSLRISQLREWEQEGTIEWWGTRHDMPAVYAQASIVVLPSLREGLPKVLIEAAACGLPVVASDVPGCREAVVPGETGFLVKAGDAAEFARCVRVLLDDSALAARMGAQGRLRAVREFSVDAVTEQTMDALRALQSIQRKPPRGFTRSKAPARSVP